ncbi:radical SAM family heme chaperone HemW [Ruminococcus albus]|uniref:Heme chaperone HemW n=1 Tax=Ruminococcus albus 8 TaxID=246199 RepID=E9S9N6_RUMAL|nr:radical SAM family heme chaperone HemW [Ruminococcus albus]EGC04009.1 putative coproporphyrinogen dehydrogenase [Ruminococcus albus 8]MCC3352844.1 radical SAM family heme chaperone HemW [Ruminococcus albus 8]
MLGIYVHVPFCLRKCPYCSFYSLPYDEDTAEKYVQAICRNIAYYKDRGLRADTLYLGGGTPSVLTAEQLGRILNECRQVFLLDNAEITLEANPCTVDEHKMRELRDAGFNRISFGIQSVDNDRLRFLGRLHDSSTAVNAVLNAQKAGFENISGDIMLGAANEDINSLCSSLEAICSLPLKHVSAYMLKIEKGTPFYDDKYKNLIADDDLMSELYLTAVEMLEKKGFKQYEISNFAMDGYQSRHNNKYWQGEEYIGFGPSAHSFFNCVRYFCPPDLKDFIESDLQTCDMAEADPDKAEEYILLGLRLRKGISLDKVSELYSTEAAEKIRKLAEMYKRHGLVICDGNTVSLTAKGFLVSNSIISEFIGVCDEKR